jgi:septum formation protein
LQAETNHGPGVFEVRSELILASASTRRQRLLAELGLKFKVLPASVPEEPNPGESPAAFVLRLARAKAGEVSRQHPGSWVLGADTIVVFAGRIIGKPADSADAERLLILLSGNRHEVLTGFCLCRGKDQVVVSRVVRTEVEFAPFGKDIAAAYVATGEPLDKAGAYGIQGVGGFLVAGINGSYSNVVGLPLAEVVVELLRYDVIAPS